MEDKTKVRIAIRQLVEFIMRRGDINSSFMTASSAVEGTRVHQRIQKMYKDMYQLQGIGYVSEVSLKLDYEYKDFNCTVEGRADGIVDYGDETFMIDEIKSTTQNLEVIDEEYNELHWAQAKCYGYIYGIQNGKKQAEIQLTYGEVEGKGIKNIKKLYSIEELKEFFYDLLQKYYKWAKFSMEWRDIRNTSIKKMEFPFPNYRKGQREMAVYIYKTILENKKIFVEAPTGIGKTISSLFPSVKAIGEGEAERIFYLTAKTTTKHIAEEALNKMSQEEVRMKTITLTAKEKICFKEEKKCTPKECELARGHFDRVNEAIWDMINEEDDFKRETIELYARKYSICPFEFSLDLSLWCECIICDYNYVFDPRASLKRFFETSGEFIFLIDEAHNLVDRARSMYSAELIKEEFLRLKKLTANENSELSRCFNNVNKAILKYKKQIQSEGILVVNELPEEMYNPLNKLLEVGEKWLAANEESVNHKEVLDAYFNVNAFLRIWEMYDDNFVTYIQELGEKTVIKLFCINPGKFISDTIKKGRGAAFFSATLMPMNYYRTILGSDEKDYAVRLGSPYLTDNLGLFIANNISTRYKDRETSKTYVVNYIKTMVSYKKGNYLVFFPSYKYMRDVYEILNDEIADFEIILQEDSMDEQAREEFIDKFKEDPEHSMIAFAVLGGMFSEGIDLKGNKLIGAIVVGVGLPQICLERNIIKDFFQNKDRLGYEFSYMYPGMCKVLQAAGRVIRTAEDKGTVLLIDDRFTTKDYLKMFPEHWKHFQTVNSQNDLEKKLKYFWG